MTTAIKHEKRLLLVDDKPSKSLLRWLRDENYLIHVAKSFQEAVHAIQHDHFHLAIIDIRLEEHDSKNEDGMKLLKLIEKQKLSEVMPCIVLTAYPNIDNILIATQQWRVARYIQKTGNYKTELLNAIEQIFTEKIKINFNLEYEVDSQNLLTEIAQDVNWSMGAKPSIESLELELKDLFGKLFTAGKRIYATKLKPGLTGAAVVRVEPTWQHGPGPSSVVKVGRRDKIETEHKHYEDNVQRYLNNAVTKVDYAYTMQMGGLQYTFAQSGSQSLMEFDEYYERNQADKIVASLHYLFSEACRFWYDLPAERKRERLSELYYAAFELDEKKLIQRIQVVLPAFMPETPTFQLELLSNQLINPIAWLNTHDAECILPVFKTITHGDLTGRNIMVNEEGRCWLIDFYRTKPSHILRDFVILESDIKYRLLPSPNLQNFLQLEQILLECNPAGSKLEIAPGVAEEIKKAATVIFALRQIGYNLGKGMSTTIHKEYLLSLLMTTLNVIRLRHIEQERKVQAMLSASLICAELDKLAGRRVATDIAKLYPVHPAAKAVRIDADAVPVAQTFSFIAQQSHPDAVSRS